VIPKDNEKDLVEIPANVKKGLTIIPVSHVDEVIAHALSRKPEPIDWEEKPDEIATPVGDNRATSLPH
jgi:ATP-dependent Lon protease